MKCFWAGLLIIILGFSACNSVTIDAPKIEVRDAWVRAASTMVEGISSQPTAEAHSMMSKDGLNSAAYMIIVNKGDVNDRLLRVEGDVSQVIELHRSEMIDGVMRMSPVENIEIAAGNRVELKPGGLHVMLIGIKGNLKPGDQVILILVFELAGRLNVQAEVRAP